MVFRKKSWICEGNCLFTTLWTPNFCPSQVRVKFIPFWIQFHGLPLEFRESSIIEVLGNQLGIFLNQDF